MAQIPKGKLIKGPYKPICRDCAIYFSITVLGGSFKRTCSCFVLVLAGMFNNLNWRRNGAINSMTRRKLLMLVTSNLCFKHDNLAMFMLNLRVFFGAFQTFISGITTNRL